ncbi:rRNA pseudouridine synthase [Mycoplasma enhydrae]|uniref:pseudouridine synthase n=1 Tax=Mycoplasma enhydrae TaxID=2499220 RepID=UPI00197B98CB|nr:pseudouridine synthase [Mycoplasma enhydrae]MBN4089510.1 rRNA pseudouridine synthase [Mycoplasma enhydrae]MCV3733645.1 rRNA pseudouridine synthase [Mycoplasma enhydrae]MCV3753374.1 rRNA pseudouridine synthase [Mycoplasma enhydrae]
MEEKLKVQKIISDYGYCSRREAEKLIIESRVLVNGALASIGQRVSLDDEIRIDNKVISNKTSKFYILLNKPQNTICTLKDPQGRKTIYEWININKYCYSIGRLDYNTTGVIIITNDGDFANILAHPSSEIEREYIVTLEKPLSDKELNYLNSNFVKLNGVFSKQKVTKIKDLVYSIKLNEGRNHHVKNLFLLVNNYVKKLHRKRYGILDDTNLKIGEFREIKSSEIEQFKKETKKIRQP